MSDNEEELLEYALECSLKYQDMIKKSKESSKKSYLKYKHDPDFKAKRVVNTRNYFLKNPEKRKALDKARYLRNKAKTEKQNSNLQIMNIDELFSSEK